MRIYSHLVQHDPGTGDHVTAPSDLGYAGFNNVASAVKNFLENYAEIHGLPSLGRSVNRITQSVIF